MINYMKRTDIISDIRRGVPDSRIARERECSRNTVRGLRREYQQALEESGTNPKALEEFIRNGPRYKQRESIASSLTPEVKAIIDKDLEDNRTKIATGQRKQQKKGTDIHQDLVQAGYDISYRTVQRYIQSCLESRSASVHSCFIKQEYIPGERMEFDWGEVKIFIDGELRTYNMAVTSLCSNGRWARLFTRQDKPAMLEAHVRSFAFWGHSPQYMVYDNMRTAVASFTGREKKPTAELCQLKAFYAFQPQFCNVRSGNEKGHVERSVEVVRRLAFAHRDRFKTLEEANDYLLSVCERENDRIRDKIDEELREMHVVSDGMSCFEAFTRSADKEATISVDTNHYSVPYRFTGKTLWVKVFSDEVVIYDMGKNKDEVARHARCHGTDEWVMDIQHYLEVLQVKPGAVRNSVALRQTPQELQTVFDTWFRDKPKNFVDLLLWARDSRYTYQDICSAVRVARMKGISDISFETLKSTLTDCTKMVEVIKMPWSKDIEKGSEQNFAALSRLFNHTSIPNS